MTGHGCQGTHAAALVVTDCHPGKTAEREEDDEHKWADEEEMSHICLLSFAFPPFVGSKVMWATGGVLCKPHSSTNFPTTDEQDWEAVGLHHVRSQITAHTGHHHSAWASGTAHLVRRPSPNMECDVATFLRHFTALFRRPIPASLSPSSSP